MKLAGCSNTWCSRWKPPIASLNLLDNTVSRELDVLTNHQDEREKPGEPSPYACPDCGGVLWELTDDEILRFRCRVGHAFTAETLLTTQAHAVEQALWSALRALEEQAAVTRRIAERLRRHGHDVAADQVMARARALQSQGQQVRRLLLSGVSAAEH